MDDLKDSFKKYLIDIKHLSDRTIQNYIAAIPEISKYIKLQNNNYSTLYEISDVHCLNKLSKDLKQNECFREKNAKEHRTYSSALKAYIEWRKSMAIQDKMQSHIVEEFVPIDKERVINTYERNSKIKDAILEKKQYLCEIDKHHKTFISSKTSNSYMEGHHIIPISKQAQVNMNLDIEENIICLCPTCHRFLHYGDKNEVKRVLRYIYTSHIDGLRGKGINLTEKQFIELILS